MDWDKIREQFPVLGRGVYANTAATGLLSDGLLEWRQEHDLDFLIGGSEMIKNTYKLLSETRHNLALFFNAENDNIALVPSFSIGLNLLLEGLSEQERVLMIKGDYPSLVWPFENRDFNIQYVDMSSKLEEVLYNTIETKKITVLALSMVQWLNGITMAPKFLQQLKNDFKDLLILADGTQFCGMQDFDFNSSGVDVLGASGYKWLLSGYGNGFFLFKEEVKNRFSLKSKGYGSGRNAPELDHRRTFCKHLEPGHLSSLNFGSLNFSLKYLNAIGKSKISEQNEILSKHAMNAFYNLGMLDEDIDPFGLHSTIFKIKSQNGIFDILTSKNIVCAQRGGGIRLSFHFYNTIEEIEFIENTLKKAR
ncbi:MAG: aminotransferase class V-fold PLP-dependent enzyme [Croceitalea sp.]|nr:aminotransferase class V-fold PLP-dependent enzyme [Croceitalea sp.]